MKPTIPGHLYHLPTTDGDVHPLILADGRQHGVEPAEVLAALIHRARQTALLPGFGPRRSALLKLEQAYQYMTGQPVPASEPPSTARPWPIE